MAGAGKAADPPSHWVAAERWAAVVRDHGIDEALRIYYTRYLPVGVPLLLALGSLLGQLVVGGGWEKWPVHFRFGVLAMVIGCGIGGWIYTKKRMASRVELGWGEVLIALNSSDKKAVLRQIGGKAPVDRNRLVVARAVAVQQRWGIATGLLYVPCFLTVFGYGPGLRWTIPVGLLAVAAVYIMVRDFRRYGRFLRETAGLS